MKINLNQLRSFYVAAKYSSVTRAAEILFVTPPAITMQIKKLEEWLGFPLLCREHNKIRISRDAEEIYSQAEVIFGAVEKLETSLEQMLRKRKGELLIGSHHIPAKYILPGLMELIHELQPRLEIKVVLDTIPSLMERLLRQEVHIVLSASPAPCSRIKTVRLFREELALVARPDSRHITGPAISKKELGRLPFLLQERDTILSQMITCYFQAASITPRVIMENINADLIKNFILKDMGVAFLPRFSVDDKIGRGELQEITVVEGLPWIEFNLGVLADATPAPHAYALASSFADRPLPRSQFIR